jgi:two-component system, chemotaxis family, protein-glutamate methylesterase/glutaminase
MIPPKIKVLIVEDSSVVQMLLVHLLNSDPRIQVIGTATNGRDALQFLTQSSPDVILMDIDMPEMDGFEATRRIMETRPVPIIICSGSRGAPESRATHRLIEAGALACVQKPFRTEGNEFETTVAHLLQTIKLMAEVKVVRRWAPREVPTVQATALPPSDRARTKVDLIGIGASTGGPPVLQTILLGLPKDIPVPLLVVQHISPGFLGGLVDWLDQTTGFKVHAAAHGTETLPGHVYLAPDGCHMAIRAGRCIALNKQEPENNLRPSIAHLFRSLVDVCGASAAGVLLTGMGRDGADELKRMKDRGAVTIVQDRDTSVVHGMPGEAIALGAATYVLPADRIAPALIAELNQQSFREGRQ